MILPATRTTVCELVDLPHNAGEIPTAQVKLEDLQVADFANWLDESLTDLEHRFHGFATPKSTLNALFQGSERR